jgi:hypothetical protein
VVAGNHPFIVASVLNVECFTSGLIVGSWCQPSVPTFMFFVVTTCRCCNVLFLKVFAHLEMFIYNFF